MSDRTQQALANLTYEVISTTVDQLRFSERLQQRQPDLITANDIQVVKERLHRLRTIFNRVAEDNKPLAPTRTTVGMQKP